MSRLIYPSEQSLAFGFLLFFLGIPGVFFLDVQTTQHKLLRFVSCCFFLVGLLWFHAVLFVRWSRDRLPPKPQSSPVNVAWERLVAIVLWLGVLPFALLWVYHHLEKLRSPV